VKATHGDRKHETDGMKLKIARTELVIEQGNLVDAQADALLLPGNNFLWLGGREALAVKQAAGEVVEEEATAQGPAAIGDVIVTSGGALAVRKLLHAVIVGQDLRATSEGVELAVRTALERTAEARISSLAMACLGLDPGHLDAHKAADAQVGAVIDGLIAGTPLSRVRIVTPDEATHRVFVERAGAHFTLPK
jgi:O-acetyl-ADP-ribose deacetylase (regulator of RNase III)